MEKEDKAKKTEEDLSPDTEEKAPKKPKKSISQMLFPVALVMTMLFFIGYSIILIIGMVPSVVAFVADTSNKKLKAMTVSAMNLAGCMLYIVKLWNAPEPFQAALEIITDPMAIIIMYSAAGVGYVLDWAMTGLSQTIGEQRARSRQNIIEKQQKKLIDQWGKDVSR